MTRRMILQSPLAILVIFHPGCSPHTRPLSVERPSHSWGMDPLWDDGLAEVAKYQAQRTVYSRTREYEAMLIRKEGSHSN